LEVWILSKALGGFAMNVDMNAFGQNLEEQLGSTSEGAWFIDLGAEKLGPLLREIKEDNFKV